MSVLSGRVLRVPSVRKNRNQAGDKRRATCNKEEGIERSTKPCSLSVPARARRPSTTLFTQSYFLLHRLVLSSFAHTAPSSRWPPKRDFARISIKISQILRTSEDEPTRPRSVPGPVLALRGRMSLCSTHLRRRSTLSQVSQISLPR